MFHHVSVEFHHLPFLARAKQKDGHPSRMTVPNFSPAGVGFGGELSDGHVRNHRCYTHGGTVGDDTVPTFYPAGWSG